MANRVPPRRSAADAASDLQHLGSTVVMGVYVQDTNADAGKAGGWRTVS